MSKSLLRLEDSWITRLEFRTGENPGGDNESDESTPRLTWETEFSSDQASYLVKMRVTDHNDRFHLLIDMTGRFSLDPRVSEEARLKMVNLNGTSILYGIARGIVASIAGLSEVKRYILPSLNVVAMADRRDKLRLKQATKLLADSSSRSAQAK